MLPCRGAFPLSSSRTRESSVANRPVPRRNSHEFRYTRICRFSRRIPPAAGTNIPIMWNRNQPTTNGKASTPIDWGTCLTEHQGWLRSVILARTGEPQAVDEVWQEVSLAAVRQASPLHDAASAPAWLYRLAVVQSIRYRRQQARQR